MHSIFMQTCINKHWEAQLLRFWNNGSKDVSLYLTKITSLSHQFVVFTGKTRLFASLETVDLAFSTHHMQDLCWDELIVNSQPYHPHGERLKSTNLFLQHQQKVSLFFLPQNQASLAATIKKKSVKPWRDWLESRLKWFCSARFSGQKSLYYSRMLRSSVKK